MEDTLTHLYCLVDDFYQEFLPLWKSHQLSSGIKKRDRKGQLSAAEITTIVISFHQSHFRTFKHYYCCYVQPMLKNLFNNLVSYERFVTLTNVNNG